MACALLSTLATCGILCSAAAQSLEKFEFISGTFPPDFIWAAATSAYQIEGGWNADGKGPSLWDKISHMKPSPIADHSTGDVTCDSYHKWRDDIELLKTLKVSHYRFSISWPRILPTGFLKDGVNQKGADYYMNLIDNLRENNIQPIVTMYHFDIPLTMSDMGAWLNESFGDWFADYATLLFKLYGHKAHANFIPGTNDTKDIKAAERAYEFNVGIFSNPIFNDGDWPEIVKSVVERKSIEQGYKKSRLPLYSESEKRMLKGAVDFFGLNVYTSSLVFDSDKYTDKQNASFENDKCVYTNKSASWPASSVTDWLKFTPSAPRAVLDWIKRQYGNVPVIITESGWSDKGAIDDFMREKFYKEYINSALQAYLLDGANIKGFTAWTLMDNFEWTAGFTQKFGLAYVDFTDPNRARIPKKSAAIFAEIVQNNGFPKSVNR